MAEEENPAKRLRPNSVSGTSSKSSSGMKDRNMDYICPICFDLIRYVMGTRLSISRDIFLAAKLTSPSVVTPSATPVSSRPSSRTAGQTPAKSKPVCILCCRCPKCNFTLDSPEQIFPNFLFNELVSKYKNSLENKIHTSNLLQHPDLSAFRTTLSSNFESMSLPDVELMLKLLEAKKQQLAANSVLAQKQLLKEFLQHLKKQKDEQLFSLQKEAAVIQVRRFSLQFINPNLPLLPG